MKQKLLADIELDVHELKYLMESFSKEPTETLSGLLKRNIVRMQERLDELQQEIDAAQVISPTVVIEEEAPIIVEKKPVKIEETLVDVEESATVTVAKEEGVKSTVLGECLKLSAGLRHSISLNDSFRFSRELFGGDTELMNRVVEQMSVMSSYKTAVAFLSSKVEVDEEKEAVNDFLELLKKYFN